MEQFTETQRWNPEKYAAQTSYISEYGRKLVDMLDPQPGERILDLGCGDGVLMQLIAERGALVYGVDSSEEMVEAAKKKGLQAWVEDAQNMNTDRRYDAVFSNAALHWMPDATGVVDRVWKSLEEGGRFVAEMGGKGNIAALRTAVAAAYRIVVGEHMPSDHKFFPSPRYYASLLEERGFNVSFIDLIYRPTLLQCSLAEWFEVLGGRFFHGLDTHSVREIVAQTEELLAPQLKNEDGQWLLDYVRLRFRAVRRSAS